MRKNIIRLAIGTALLLLIPLALTIRDGNVPNVGWNWSPGDFVVAFVVIFGMGLAYVLVATKSRSMQYKLGVGLGILTAFLLLWINAAVGFIGDSPVPNALYLPVFAIGFFGGFLSRFEPKKLSYTLFAAAVAQMSVPTVAFLLWGDTISWSPGVLQVFILNAVFAALFAGSALLFRQAALRESVRA